MAGYKLTHHINAPVCEQEKIVLSILMQQSASRC